jgi:hypothetical protein
MCSAVPDGWLGLGAASGVTLVHQPLEVLALDAHTAADADGRQGPGVDPVADRLRVELEGLGDLVGR